MSPKEKNVCYDKRPKGIFKVFIVPGTYVNHVFTFDLMFILFFCHPEFMSLPQRSEGIQGL